MESKSTEEIDYRKDKLPQTPQEWKKWKEERWAKKRKWKEEKMIKAIEKQREKESEEQVKKKLKEDEDKSANIKGRHYTLSIALPGSILDNAQTPELRSYLAGQIARAAVVFNVDEIIIFDETGSTTNTTEGNYEGVGKKGQANLQMARILQYLECPQYLRKAFFPQHKDLKYAGLLNPLDCSHHVKAAEDSLYREGVVLDKPVKDKHGSFVDVGLQKEIQIDKKLQHGIRVTVKMDPGYLDKIASRKKVLGQVVSPNIPRTDHSIYWGYNVRLADSLSKVFTESPHKEGYDVSVGTSERGSSVDEFKPDKFRHMLVVFGGVKGLECSLDVDQDLHMDDPSLLFNYYLNTCPGQGSNTIRTEEAILISLSALRPKITETQQAR